MILIFLQGEILDIKGTATIDDCLNMCKAIDICQWFSFRVASNECMIFRSCHEVIEGQTDYTSGQKNCDLLASSKFQILSEKLQFVSLLLCVGTSTSTTTTTPTTTTTTTSTTTTTTTTMTTATPMAYSKFPINSLQRMPKTVIFMLQLML